MEILRKLTLKNAAASVADIKKAVAQVENGQSVPLLKVAGVVAGFKADQSDKGEYLLLLGEFFGLNLLDGSQYSSTKAILPNFIAENFIPVLRQNGTVEFSIEIGAKRDDSRITGYTFVAKPLREAEASTKLASLAATLGVSLATAPAALAAPAAAAPVPEVQAWKDGKDPAPAPTAEAPAARADGRPAFRKVAADPNGPKPAVTARGR
jgi:hypothetical protein